MARDPRRFAIAIGVGAVVVGFGAWWLLRDTASTATPETDEARAIVDDAPTRPGKLEPKPGVKLRDPAVKPAPDDPKDTDASKRADEVKRGRVVDGDGKPLAGLRVRLVWGGLERALRRAGQAVPEAVAAMSRQATDPKAVAVTDADGRFEIHGAGDRLVSDSPEWQIDSITLDGQTTVAEPGFRLTATVTDAATGKPVEKFEGHAQWSGHTWRYVSFDGTDGRVEIRAERWWGKDVDAIVDLAVESPEYVPVQVHVPYLRGEHAATADVRLTPVKPDEKAHVTLEVVDAAGQPFDGPWWVRVVDPRDSTQTITDLGLPERTGPGLYSLVAPPGRWTLLVKPNDSLGFLRWTGERDLARGENRVRVQMKPHGTLVVRWPKGWGTVVGRGENGELRDPDLGVFPSDGSAGSGLHFMSFQASPEKAGELEYRSTTCLEGTWRIDITGPDGALKRNVQVRAGEEAVVDFGVP